MIKSVRNRRARVRRSYSARTKRLECARTQPAVDKQILARDVCGLRVADIRAQIATLNKDQRDGRAVKQPMRQPPLRDIPEYDAHWTANGDDVFRARRRVGLLIDR
jgi:hypothetical protein